ncbi:MAG: glycoside hydrolase family 9 protein [Planctomycetota bacterium]
MNPNPSGVLWAAASMYAILAGGAQAAEPAGEPAEPAVIKLDRPFLFAYGTWEKKAKIENGSVSLDANGMSPKGGAGVVLIPNADLSTHSDDCPALQLKVGPRNTLKTLRFLLGDAAEHSRTWHFALPRPSDQAVVLTPNSGASFSQGNEPGKGVLALGKVAQWQMMGDWGGDGAVDVRVLAILAVKPDDNIRKARVALAKQEEEARIQAEKDRQANRAKYAKPTPDSPEIQAVYAAAPDVLALQIHSGKITPCKLSDYQPQPGDVKDDKGGKDRPRLKRNGKDLGMLIGPPGKESGLVAFEGFSGDPLLLAEADDAANYKIKSPDDPAFAKEIAPLAVMRKSKPDDWQQPAQTGITIRHNIFLKLPQPLTPGKTYSIALGYLNTQKPEATLVFDTAKAWTESIHVNQVGFRSDDPLKRAFLSLWMGAGGGYVFPPKLTFHLVEAAGGQRVYTGTVGEAWPADKPEKMQTTRNFNGAAVSPLDFSDFKTPGQYRVEVEGLGCSYPFEIGPKTWEKAFWVQMKGFFNQRSGMELGPPYTDFVRPTCWKPGVNDCMPITQSAYSILDGGDPQKDLAAKDTGQAVPEAWGGYHDAGDWNPRRITHMTTTTFWQLELLELFPEYFKGLKLNIPNDAPGPDLLKECLFELDLFRRLQLPDGGCRFGIETNGDPGNGEVSWKQHMPAYVYAPDLKSSCIYAAVASRAAQVLEPYDQALAKTYRETALKAMQWAESDRAKRKAQGTWKDEHPVWAGGLSDERARAAVCLYALTRDPQWNAIFLEETTLKTNGTPAFRGNYVARDAAFTYARLPEGLGDPQVRQNARHAVIADADGSLAYQQNNAFGIASDDFGKPHIIGFYSTPHGAVSLVRAHYLTTDAKYLAGALKACLFPGGANPSNLVYTSGVGANPIQHPLNMDSLATGQKPPLGLTPYGNIDFKFSGTNSWEITWFLGKGCQPGAYEWPTTEAFFDVRLMIMECEFCIDQTMGPNAYVWGYLAAR